MRVRSKSEGTIVDLLLEYEALFRYECKIFLRGLGEIHPDFIILNKRTGEEFVWEHFGKVDDWKYANDMVDQAVENILAGDVKPQAVEKAIRTAVESTWLSGSLNAIQSLFGYSVDAERGKPTNAEFLAMLSGDARRELAHHMVDQARKTPEKMEKMP